MSKESNFVEIAPLTGALGCEIMNIDISSGLDEAVFTQVQQALNDYSLVLFRNQHVSQQ